MAYNRSMKLLAADDLRAEYDFDFSKGERGRYYKKLLKEGSNIVVLEPDLRLDEQEGVSKGDPM